MNINIADEFHLRDELIYVNHAAVAPWPVRTAKAVADFADENCVQGSKNYLQWIETETRLREYLRQLINAAEVAEIGLLKSTSEALSVVAYGIDWQPGDSIVTAAAEFPSNRIVWESLRARGVDVRIVVFTDDRSPEDCLIEQIDQTTRLVSTSSVQYANGFRMDLAKLGNYCRQHQVLFCVDAIQSIGALQLDVQEIHADFVAADGHKWMLGAEGLALFYCRRDLIQQLKLHQYGWHMVENNSDFDAMNEWQPASSARRFECGSPNMLGTIALHASLSLIHDIGISVIEQQVLANTAYLIDALTALPDVRLLSVTDENRRSGIITFTKPDIENATLFERLKAHDVVCAMRGGGIRFSPHFYTAREKLQTLVQLVKTNCQP